MRKEQKLTADDVLKGPFVMDGTSYTSKEISEKVLRRTTATQGTALINTRLSHPKPKWKIR